MGTHLAVTKLTLSILAEAIIMEECRAAALELSLREMLREMLTFSDLIASR